MGLPSRFDRVSFARVAVALLVTALLAALVAATDDPVGPAVIATVALVTVFLLATAFDPVREHPLYHVLNAAVLVAVVSLWIAAGYERGVVPTVLLALAAVGLLVELYNYRRGTSYLRLD